MFTRDMQQTELGIEPDVKVDIAPADYARGIDTIIETARRLLKENSFELQQIIPTFSLTLLIAI